MARGRKRKDGPREPNGRLSRRKAWDSNLKERETMAVATEARKRHFGLTDDQAKDARAGSVIGLLSMGKYHSRPDGAPCISSDQYDAAVWYLSKRADYLSAIGAPIAFDPGGLGTGDPDAHAKFCARARADWEMIRSAIMEAQVQHRTRNLFAAVEMFLVRDVFLAHLLGDLQLALNALHKIRMDGVKRRLVA